MYRAKSQSSPQKFRKMTWLETRNASCATQPLSPSKALLLHKEKTKGVKQFRPEKHSRFSSLGSHVLTVRSQVDSCGLSHEEVAKALDMPDKKAVSTKAEKRLGSVPRFDGPNTHFAVASSATVESCGLSHDEEKRARNLPERRGLTMNANAGLGGLTQRFNGPTTHFMKGQGADFLLGQLQTHCVASVTMPKSNWLKNLWAVAGTALQDREMIKCEAIIAPTLPSHGSLEGRGTVLNMAAPSGSRFTYQKPTSGAALGGYIGHETSWQPKGASLMKPEKHSRFSTFGSHFKTG